MTRSAPFHARAALSWRVCWLLVVALATPVTGSAASPTPPLRTDWVAPLEHDLRRAEKDYDLSGAVLVAQGDRVRVRRAYGQAERSFAVPNRVDTRFNLGSMNKMFTALATLRLVQQHRLTLDDPIVRWLPDYPKRAVAERVTVRQLLGHTSGMGNFWDALRLHPQNAVCSTAQFAALFADAPLESEPGTRFAYSNSGYIVLGLLIEAVTGESYEAHVQRTVFTPLRMHDTGALPLDHVVARRAAGHVRSQETPHEWLNNAYVNVFCGTAAGGGYSTVDDLHRFGRALADGTLLEPEMMALYSTGVNPYSKGRYALGLSEETIAGHRVIGHSGGHVGIAGELLVVPDTGHVAVILTNGDVDAFWYVRATIVRHLLGDDEGNATYWRTLKVIARTEADGERAGREEAERVGGAPKLRESVIDVTAGKWLHRGDAARALSLLRLNTSLFPASDDAWLRLADSARVLGEVDQAITAYERYLSRVPDDKDAAAHLKSLQARATKTSTRGGG